MLYAPYFRKALLKNKLQCEEQIYLKIEMDSVITSITTCRFDRDWKKIEAFVASKTVIQVLPNLLLVNFS